MRILLMMQAPFGDHHFKQWGMTPQLSFKKDNRQQRGEGKAERPELRRGAMHTAAMYAATRVQPPAFGKWLYFGVVWRKGMKEKTEFWISSR